MMARSSVGRTSDFESESRKFEPCRASHKNIFIDFHIWTWALATTRYDIAEIVWTCKYCKLCIIQDGMPANNLKDSHGCSCRDRINLDKIRSIMHS